MSVDSEQRRVQFREWSDRQYVSTADAYAERDRSIWSSPTGTAATLAQVIRDSRPSRVLELGVGTGRYFPFLSGEAFVGVDVSPAMLQHARARTSILRERGFDEVTLIEDEVTAYLNRPASGSSFDFIFSIGCIGYHVAPSARLLERIHALLSPGGQLFLQTTQQAFLRRARSWTSTRVDWLRGRQTDRAFFVSTTRRQLRDLAGATGLQIEWMKDDSRQFFNKPLLLSCYRK